MAYLSPNVSVHNMTSAYTNFSVRENNTLNVLNKTQSTISQACTFEGVGVHSGNTITMTVRPAEINTGIIFVRSDITASNTYNQIEARFDYVTDTRMSTTITNPHGVSVSTIEHVMAALIGAGITNAYIDITGSEVPIMDGSSAIFTHAFQNCGLYDQHERQHLFMVQKPVRVESSTGFAEYIPSVRRTFNVYYDFCGRFTNTPYESGYQFDLDRDSFATLISDARTFGLYEDGLRLQQMGLAKGASLDNTIVLKDMRVMNEDGLRSDNEFVRHKILDALGDVSLAGCMILGAYNAHNPSHDLNNKLLRAFFQYI